MTRVNPTTRYQTQSQRQARVRIHGQVYVIWPVLRIDYFPPQCSPRHKQRVRHSASQSVVYHPSMTSATFSFPSLSERCIPGWVRIKYALSILSRTTSYTREIWRKVAVPFFHSSVQSSKIKPKQSEQPHQQGGQRLASEQKQHQCMRQGQLG